MVWTCSLIRLRSRCRFSLGVGGTEPSKLQTSLCSTGIFRLDTQGQGRPNTITHLYTTPPRLALLSLRSKSSALQGKSLTAPTLAGEQSATLGFILQVTPKKKRTTIMLPTRSCDGRRVGWSGLRHRTVASRGCDSILWSLQSNIPQCLLVKSPLLSITLLRTFKTLPPFNPLSFGLTFFSPVFKHWSELLNCNFLPMRMTDYRNAPK